MRGVLAVYESECVDELVLQVEQATEDYCKSGGRCKMFRTPVEMEEVQAAALRIRPFVHATPVLTSTSLDAIAGRQLFFKAENLQKTGSFKARGAFPT